MRERAISRTLPLLITIAATNTPPRSNNTRHALGPAANRIDAGCQPDKFLERQPACVAIMTMNSDLFRSLGFEPKLMLALK